MTTYDPELAPHVPLMPALDLRDVGSARDEMERLGRAQDELPPLRDVRWTDEVASRGEVEVPVRVYRPDRRSAEPTPVVLFLHGGGYVMGSVDSEHRLAGILAVAIGAVVVSVDYRLAPEHPYPAAVEDAYAALQWVNESRDPLGIDTHRLAVVGHSAGGGLAAALTILARDRGGPPICFQLLGMPEVDDRMVTRSSQEFVDTPSWTRRACELSWRYYLGDLHGLDDLPLTAAPGRAAPEELAGLPSAYVSAMQNDPLRDEGVNYALALMHAGVLVELHTYPGTFHGSAHLPSRVSKRQHRDEVACLRQALGVHAD
jgi:acetyl esterase